MITRIEDLEESPIDCTKREDLFIAKAILQGNYRGVKIENPESHYHTDVAFSVGNIHVWKTQSKWQIADVVENIYQKHRGFTTSLFVTLASVREEIEQRKL